MTSPLLMSMFGNGHAWQDIVIAVISILFGFILLPQLKDVWKRGRILNVYTAGLTTIGLYILAATFVTMGFWISVIADIFSGTVWLLLFVFSLINLRKERGK